MSANNFNLNEDYTLSQTLNVVAAAAGTSIDTFTNGGKARKVVMIVGSINTCTVQLEESDDGTTWTVVGTAQNLAAAGSLYFEHIHPKRYVRGNATAVAATGGGVVANIMLTNLNLRG